jgi:choline-sulfatase
MGSVTGAGTAEITNQLEYDDEVGFLAAQRLHDLARRADPRPWCLTVSFSHPHDPYVARQRCWDLYEDCPALDPEAPPVPFAALDPHSQRLLVAADHTAAEITPDDVRAARRGYFAHISYVDEQIGTLLGVLDRCGFTEDTVILFVSDHGDLLGEAGLWFKMSFREGSARVPLMLAGPGIAPGLEPQPVSTLDVCPTLAALAGIPAAAVAPFVDGESLADGASGRGPVPMEYAAEGSASPMVALRDGRFKLILSAADAPLLYDLEADPAELANLAGDPAHAATLAALAATAGQRWDLAAFDAEVRASQARRRLVYEALRQGAYTPRDFQPRWNAGERFMRNHMNLDNLEASKRYPRP